MGDDAPLLCVRCLATLTPGAGNFWVIRIDAVADPTPPEFTPKDLQRDVRGEFARLVRQMHDCSAREAMDQVHRQMVIHLCNRCYTDWIENPAG